MKPITYLSCTITYWPPPIPSRAFDYHWVHDDYDGPEDHRSGDGASVEDCQHQIEEMLGEWDE